MSFGRTLQKLATTARRWSYQSRSVHKGPKRLTFVQYGNYGDAFERFESGGEENYYAQQYTVAHVGRLMEREDVESVAVVNFASDKLPVVLSNGVESSGVQLFPEGKEARHAELLAAVERTSPTHLVVAAPLVPLLRWGLRKELVLLALFADSFQGEGLRTKVRNHRLAFVLNDPRIELVANHNLASSLDLARIGVDTSKVVPFDWPAVISPRDWPAKSAPRPEGPLRLAYVGMLQENKGIGDAIKALSELRSRGRDVSLTVIGSGEQGDFEKLAEELNIRVHVHFAGRVSHATVLETMRECDVVLVPSWSEYPEGLPMTLYEALCTRTPLVASDHPMFKLRIRDGLNAVVHREKDPVHLADSVLRLIDDPQLYERLSRDAERADNEYLCPLKWDQLVSDFLSDVDRPKLLEHSLKNTATAG